MNDHKIKSNLRTASKAFKSDRRWTVLLIGERGKTVTFEHFKSAIITTVVLLLCISALAAWYWNLHRKAVLENRRLSNRIENLEQANESLRDERDLIMARLVRSESRVADTLAKARPADPPKPEKTEADQPKPKESLKQSPKPEAPLSVTATDLIVFFEPDRNAFRVQYKVVNTGSKAQPVSGLTVIVLKDDPVDMKNWLALPSVPMESGRPAGDRGRAFTIYNFRTMRFSFTKKIEADSFTTATIYIFTSTGSPVFEKDFQVGVTSPAVSNATGPEESSPPNKTSSAPPLRKDEHGTSPGEAGGKAAGASDAYDKPILNTETLRGTSPAAASALSKPDGNPESAGPRSAEPASPSLSPALGGESEEPESPVETPTELKTEPQPSGPPGASPF